MLSTTTLLAEWRSEMNLPNKLTMGRIFAIPVFIVVFLFDYRYAAVVIFIVAALTDMLDGLIARKYNLVTNFGKLMASPLPSKNNNYKTGQTAHFSHFPCQNLLNLFLCFFAFSHVWDNYKRELVVLSICHLPIFGIKKGDANI